MDTTDANDRMYELADKAMGAVKEMYRMFGYNDLAAEMVYHRNMLSAYRLKHRPERDEAPESNDDPTESSRAGGYPGPGSSAVWQKPGISDREDLRRRVTSLRSRLDALAALSKEAEDLEL